EVHGVAGGLLLDAFHRVGDGRGVADRLTGVDVVTYAVVVAAAVVILGQGRSGPERQHHRAGDVEVPFHYSPPGVLDVACERPMERIQLRWYRRIRAAQ